MMIYYRRDRARDALSKKGEGSSRVMSASRNAVWMPTEYAFSELSNRAEVHVFVGFFGCRNQSVREV